VEPESPQASAQVETIFDEEDDFFDLAAELERELSEEELAADDGIVVQPQEQSLEEIIEGFKQGVADNLSPEDYDTHYNLGIAYLEMGLVDEAIGEFQLACKDDRYLVDSSSMLGQCFLEKGLPELAVRWYRKGLESPDIKDEVSMSLLYEMGNAYVSLGDQDAAYKTFVEIYGINSNYRDVASRLQDLQGSAPQ
jgi:tetratricopeptide (TPR) repeat protein